MVPRAVWVPVVRVAVARVVVAREFAAQGAVDALLYLGRFEASRRLEGRQPLQTQTDPRPKEVL